MDPLIRSFVVASRLVQMQHASSAYVCTSSLEQIIRLPVSGV